jgi:hypothetical protein
MLILAGSWLAIVGHLPLPRLRSLAARTSHRPRQIAARHPPFRTA